MLVSTSDNDCRFQFQDEQNVSAKKSFHSENSSEVNLNEGNYQDYQPNSEGKLPFF